MFASNGLATVTCQLQGRPNAALCDPTAAGCGAPAPQQLKSKGAGTDFAGSKLTRIGQSNARADPAGFCLGRRGAALSAATQELTRSNGIRPLHGPFRGGRSGAIGHQPHDHLHAGDALVCPSRRSAAPSVGRHRSPLRGHRHLLGAGRWPGSGAAGTCRATRWIASVTGSPSCRRASSRHLRAASPARIAARLGGLPLLRPLAQLAHRPRPRRRPREAARGRRAGRAAPHLRGHGLRPALLFESPRCRGWLPPPPRRGCWRWPAVPPRRRWSGWCADGGRPGLQADGPAAPGEPLLSTRWTRTACWCCAAADPRGGRGAAARLEAALEQVPAPASGRTATSHDCAAAPMRWGWWPRVRWPASSIRATPATASR